MSIDRPVLFLGTTRSGKSMAAEMLAEAREFSLAFEPLTTWDIGLSKRPDDARDASEATPKVIAQIRREIERYLERTGSTRYTDDLPHHSLRVGFCAAVLPEARFVVIYRDGRDSVREMVHGWRYRDSLGAVLNRRMGGDVHKAVRLSRLPRQGVRWLYNCARQRLVGRRHTWGPTVPGQHAFAQGHSLVETVAFQWATMIEHVRSGLASLPPERVLELRFERLRDDAVAEFGRIADFCEVADREGFLKRVEETIEPGRPHYTPALTDEENAAITPIIGPVQKALGYEDG